MPNAGHSAARAAVRHEVLITPWVPSNDNSVAALEGTPMAFTQNSYPQVCESSKQRLDVHHYYLELDAPASRAGNGLRNEERC